MGLGAAARCGGPAGAAMDSVRTTTDDGPSSIGRLGGAEQMSSTDEYDILVIGSGEPGK